MSDIGSCVYVMLCFGYIFLLILKTYSFVDFDLFDDEKFQGVCNFVKHHLFVTKGEFDGPELSLTMSMIVSQGSL